MKLGVWNQSQKHLWGARDRDPFHQDALGRLLDDEDPLPLSSRCVPLWLFRLWRPRRFALGLPPGPFDRSWETQEQRAFLRREIRDFVNTHCPRLTPCEYVFSHYGRLDFLGLRCYVLEPLWDIDAARHAAAWLQDLLGCAVLALRRGVHHYRSVRILLLPPCGQGEFGFHRHKRQRRRKMNNNLSTLAWECDWRRQPASLVDYGHREAIFLWALSIMPRQPTTDQLGALRRALGVR